MGRNASVQNEYWTILKDSKWNEGVTEMPIYSVLEICLEDNIDFSNKDTMTELILDKAKGYAEEIELYLKNIE